MYLLSLSTDSPCRGVICLQLHSGPNKAWTLTFGVELPNQDEDTDGLNLLSNNHTKSAKTALRGSEMHEINRKCVCVRNVAGSQRRTNEEDGITKKMASISVATYIPYAFTHSPYTMLHDLSHREIGVVLEHGSVAKATTAGGKGGRRTIKYSERETEIRGQKTVSDGL